MKITVKVTGHEPTPGKDYDSLINQFEFVVNGDGQKFVELVAKLIGIIPTPVVNNTVVLPDCPATGGGAIADVPVVETPKA
jgi:hypothetical protein